MKPRFHRYDTVIWSSKLGKVPALITEFPKRTAKGTSLNTYGRDKYVYTIQLQSGATFTARDTELVLAPDNIRIKREYTKPAYPGQPLRVSEFTDVFANR